MIFSIVTKRLSCVQCNSVVLMKISSSIPSVFRVTFSELGFAIGVKARDGDALEGKRLDCGAVAVGNRAAWTMEVGVCACACY